DEHRAGNRPEEHQRLPEVPAEADADQAVDEERAEDPRRQVGGCEPAARAHGEDDRDRPRGREQERDQAVREIDAAEVGERLAEGRRRTQSLRASSAALPVYSAGVSFSSLAFSASGSASPLMNARIASPSTRLPRVSALSCS